MHYHYASDSHTFSPSTQGIIFKISPKTTEKIFYFGGAGLQTMARCVCLAFDRHPCDHLLVIGDLRS